MVPSNKGAYLDWFDDAAASQSQQQRHLNNQQPVLSANLLGIDESPQLQPQQNQQVINANHATVSIVTSGAVAPNIVGLGKITPNMLTQTNKPKTKRIYVPAYSCNGGMDTKFNPHPRHAKPSDLHGILTAEEYAREICTLNDKIKKARSTSVDIALLALGPLMIPLALWGVRHGKQDKRKRTLIEEHVWDFNQRMAMDKRNIQMIWNRSKVVGGSESYLTIEEIENDEIEREDGEKEMNPLSPTLTSSTSVRSGRKKFD